MSNTVRHSKEMLDRAKRERKFIATVSVSGKHIGDDAICIQALVDIPKAQQLRDVALSLLNQKAKKASHD